MVTVETGARLHFGFQNLSLAHDRLYGGIGVALEEPRVVVEVEPAGRVRCRDSEVQPYAETAVDVLGVDGARIDVLERFERHIGFGSGTQLALACLVGTAAAYDRSVDPRARAPALGRGGRSGVGVASFENGGFVIDAGHRTERFTSQLPEPGSWTVPEPVVQRPLPEGWRFVLITPDVPVGRCGTAENASMQSVVERADPGLADDIAAVVVRRLLPAVAEGDLAQFGSAVERIGRLNGAWYADEQGGVYRPPVGTLIEQVRESDAIGGVGQSSWGPTVYGVTDVDRADRAKHDAQRALDQAEIEGTVRCVAPRQTGAVLEP